MSEFTVQHSKMKQAATVIDGYSRTISEMGDEIGTVRKNLKAQSAAMTAVSGTLLALMTKTQSQSKKMAGIGSVLSACADAYEATEKDLSGRNIGNENLDSGWRFLTSDSSVTKWKAVWEGAVAQREGEDGSIVQILRAAASAGITASGPGYKDKSGIYKWDRDEHGKVLEDRHWVKDKDGQYSIPDLTQYAKKKGTIAEAKADASAEGSIFRAGYDGSNGSAEVEMGKVEVHGSISAGLYGYTKDGKKMIAPAVDAAAGASVCVLTANADGHIGNDWLGASGDVEVNAGKASAEASASAAVFGKDGKINPQLKASASAEAIAAEAKGSAGVNLAGVEGKVSGSVNLGIGGHADIGIVDGKIKCDIGASLGVGVSVGFEIDASGLTDAIVSNTRAMWTNLWK